MAVGWPPRLEAAVALSLKWYSAARDPNMHGLRPHTHAGTPRTAAAGEVLSTIVLDALGLIAPTRMPHT